MEEKQAVMSMSALAQQTRLTTLSILSKAGSQGVNAGELAIRVGAPKNTMSAHLAILTRAGLIGQARSGRNVVYHVVPDAIIGLAEFVANLGPRSEPPSNLGDEPASPVDGLKRD